MSHAVEYCGERCVWFEFCVEQQALQALVVARLTPDCMQRL